MNKKTLVLVLTAGLIAVGIWAVFFNKPKNNYTSPLSLQTKEIKPSDTLTQYSDPSGFSFNYPDNLSLKKSEEDDESTYADLLLSLKDANGSLSLKISDSKFKSLDQWANLNKKAALVDPKEVSLGKIKGLEIITADRLYMGALDQTIFFTIEIPLVEKEFWMKVYSKILESFSFAPPVATEDSSSSDVSLEEEVVE